MMEKEDVKLISELKKISHIFSDFMTRVTKFEEIVDLGCRLLFSFQQALVFLQKPPIDKASKLVESILKANATRRVQSYIEAGCVNIHDRVQNMNKLHTCQVGLLRNLNEESGFWSQIARLICEVGYVCRFGIVYQVDVSFTTAKDVVSELEGIVNNVIVELRTVAENSPHLHNMDTSHGSDPAETASNKEIVESSDPHKPEITDHATMIAVIYSMVKQDYFMQEKIVSALNLNSSSEELESYCMMWSLRPFIDDEVMHQAWRLVT